MKVRRFLSPLLLTVLSLNIARSNYALFESKIIAVIFADSNAIYWSCTTIRTDKFTVALTIEGMT